MANDGFDEACVCLQRGDDEGALAALLEIWRAHRAPRVADLVDVVSARITARRDPVGGKTIAAQTAAWIAIESKKDPADIERLLATPWPGKWESALARLEPLLARPDDPRVAMALARIVDATAYTTWRSRNFYGPLFKRFLQLRDVRALPLMRAQLEREKPFYYRRAMRSLEELAVQSLEAEPAGGPAIPDALAPAWARVEAFFTRAEAAGAEKRRGEADFLAAIWAQPDDIALRQVYADWLSERGDERGELIAIQVQAMQSSGTPRSKRREAQLLKKHARALAGPLERHVVLDQCRFEAGFLARAKLSPDLARGASFDEPAWSTVKELVVARSQGDLAEAAICALSRRSLRSVRGVPYAMLQALARGADDFPLEELSAVLEHAEHDAAWLGDLARFPRLKRLTLLTGRDPSDVARRLVGGSLWQRLEWCAVSTGERSLGAWAGVLAAHRSASLAEFRVFDTVNEALEPSGWLLSLRRDGDASRWRLSAAFAPDSASTRARRVTGDAIQLRAAIGSLADDPRNRVTITAFELYPSPSLHLSADVRAQIERSLAALEGLRDIQLPWSSETRRTDAGSLAGIRLPDGAPDRVRVDFRGEPLGARDQLTQLWPMLQDPALGLALDSLRTNHWGVNRKLGDAPLERLATWLAKKGTSGVTLFRDAMDLRDEIYIESEASAQSRGDPGALDAGQRACTWVTVDSRRFVEPGYAERFARFIAEFCAAFDVRTASTDEAHRSHEEPHWQPIFDEVFRGDFRASALQWFTLFSSAHLEFFDAETLLQGPYHQVIRSPRGLLVFAGRSPLDPDYKTPERQAAFARNLERAFAEGLRRKLGFTFEEPYRRVLLPAAARAGFTAEPQAGSLLATGKLHLERRSDVAVASFLVQKSGHFDDPRLTASLSIRPHAPSGSAPTPRPPAVTRAFPGTDTRGNYQARTPQKLSSSLARIAEHLEGPGREWLDQAEAAIQAAPTASDSC